MRASVRSFRSRGRHSHPRIHPEKGGALLELAVVMPLLILLAIGVMDFGRVFARSIVVANAARAGAEFGAQSGATTVDTAVINQFARQDGQGVSTLRVTSQRICRCGGTGVVGCTSSCSAGYGPVRVFIEVTARDTVAMILSYPGLASRVPIARTATFRQQ